MYRGNYIIHDLQPQYTHLLLFMSFFIVSATVQYIIPLFSRTSLIPVHLLGCNLSCCSYLYSLQSTLFKLFVNIPYTFRSKTFNALHWLLASLHELLWLLSPPFVFTTPLNHSTELHISLRIFDVALQFQRVTASSNLHILTTLLALVSTLFFIDSSLVSFSPKNSIYERTAMLSSTLRYDNIWVDLKSLWNCSQSMPYYYSITPLIFQNELSTRVLSDFLRMLYASFLKNEMKKFADAVNRCPPLHALHIFTQRIRETSVVSCNIIVLHNPRIYQGNCTHTYFFQTSLPQFSSFHMSFFSSPLTIQTICQLSLFSESNGHKLNVSDTGYYYLVPVF